MTEFTVEQALSPEHEAELHQAIEAQLQKWHYQEPAVVIQVRSALDSEEKDELIVLIEQFYVSRGYPSPTVGID